MEELRDQVKLLVEMELKRANAKYPLFHSAHEGQNVIREEVEEAGDEFTNIKNQLDYLWKNVKENSDNNLLYGYGIKLQRIAISMACEAIQVAAMSRKFSDSLEVKKDE